jgi:hypothetical protein
MKVQQVFIDVFGNSIPQFGRTISSYSCCKGVISTIANSSLYHADQINKALLLMDFIVISAGRFSLAMICDNAKR